MPAYKSYKGPTDAAAAAGLRLSPGMSEAIIWGLRMAARVSGSGPFGGGCPAGCERSVDCQEH